MFKNKNVKNLQKRDKNKNVKRF